MSDKPCKVTLDQCEGGIFECKKEELLFRIRELSDICEYRGEAAKDYAHAVGVLRAELEYANKQIKRLVSALLDLTDFKRHGHNVPHTMECYDHNKIKTNETWVDRVPRECVCGLFAVDDLLKEFKNKP